MKRQLLIACCFLFAIACKKNEPSAPEGYLSSIKFTNGSSFNVIYNLFYNSDKKLERISFKSISSSTPVNSHYFLQYTAGKLDSVIRFDSITNTRLGAAGADWTGDKMTFFWLSTYTYDVQNRITNISTTSGNVFRSVFLNDSAVNYFDPPGIDPEYLSWVTYRANNVKNPFRIKGNENLFPINNYVFNFINTTTKDGSFDLAESKSSLYKTDGSIEYVTFNNYEGNVLNYPTRQTITYSSSSEVRTLEFTYR
jgi:hypothetical protein